MRKRWKLYLALLTVLCVAGTVIAQDRLGFPPKKVKSLHLNADGNVIPDQNFSEENIKRMLSHDYTNRPRPADALPSCNDDAIKAQLLKRHFTEPRGQVLASVLVAGLLMQPENQDLGAWKQSWSGSIQNVRQESMDEVNGSRFCAADLASTGGPDDLPSNDDLYKQLGLAFCVNRTLVYRIQITEDGGKPFVTSTCGTRLAN